MKLVMADPSLFTGRYDDALCRALAGRGHDVMLAGRPMRATDAIEPAGYAYAPRFFRFAERAPSPLRRMAKAAGYAFDALAGSTAVFDDAAVIHWQWLPFAAADAHWLRRLAPSHALVHTVHNARPFHGNGGREAMQARGYYDLLDRFDALVVHGEQTRAALTEAGVTRPIHLAPHPPMRLAPVRDADRRAVPGSPRPRVLFFGTIKPYKGFDLLIDAALELWGEGLDFDLGVAGQPFMPVDPLLDRIWRAGRGDRLILDLGFLPEQRLDAHLERADIVAFPYRHIDSSGAFLSALGYGAAMVTSDCGMFGDLAGDSVARFPAGDGAALTARLRALLTAPEERARLGKAGDALRDGLGSWDATAALTEAAYADALAHARRRGAAL